MNPRYYIVSSYGADSFIIDTEGKKDVIGIFESVMVYKYGDGHTNTKTTDSSGTIQVNWISDPGEPYPSEEWAYFLIPQAEIYT